MVDKTNMRGSSTTAGRRNLLKAIGATGIAITANSAIPSEWIKPVMEVGYLPAHAQNSPLPTLPIASCVSVPAPADIMLTVDVSGSLAGDIGTARQALLAFVAARDLSTNRIGVIDFDTSSDVLSPLSQDKAAIDGAINSLNVGGSTAIASGINTAINELTIDQASGNPKVIILFSDGHTNTPIARKVAVDPVAAQQARDSANAAKAVGIRIITVGIDIAGGGASSAAEALSLLRDMATSPSDFFFVENLAQLLAALSTGGICP